MFVSVQNSTFSKPCAVAINIVVLQVKLFNRIIFPIFETNFKSHQNSVV